MTAAPDPATVCLGCASWRPELARPSLMLRGVGVCRAEGLALQTMAHWPRCDAFVACAAPEVARRVMWLRAGGLYPRVSTASV